MAKLPSSVDIEKILKAVDVAGNAGSSGTRGASRGGSTGRAGGGGREAASDVTTTSSTAATDDAAPARASSDGSGAAASDDSATRSTAASDEPYDRAGGTLGRGTSSKTADLSADRWPDVLERIREERPSLAASLSEAVPSVPSAGSLGIHVPNGTRFHRDQLRDRSNMSIVESAASEIFGEAVSVELDFGARERPPDADERPAASPGAAARPRVKKETRSRPAADTEATARPGRAGETATNDPMVRKVMEMFDGRITSQRREE